MRNYFSHCAHCRGAIAKRDSNRETIQSAARRPSCHLHLRGFVTVPGRSDRTLHRTIQSQKWLLGMSSRLEIFDGREHVHVWRAPVYLEILCCRQRRRPVHGRGMDWLDLDLLRYCAYEKRGFAASFPTRSPQKSRSQSGV